MRIGINAHKLSFEAGFRQAGTSRYIEALLQELPTFARDDELIAYTGRVPEDWTARFPASIHWRHARVPTGWPPARILWEQSAGLGLGMRERLDVLHCPLNVSPLVTGAPVVVTVHDLAFERFPEHYPAFQRRYLSRMTRSSARRAARVIAVSESTKRDLVELYGIPAKRVDVVANGVERQFQPLSPDQQAAFRRQQALPDEFLLFVGTLQPRKNLDGLLRAYALIAGQLNWPLVVIGGAGWLYDPIGRVVRQLGIERRVRFQGYVEPDDLPAWYAAATIMALPSHYEGFGLPVVEAMACGTPVVTSTSSSLPEVAGDAAVLVDPASPRDIARGILLLAEDEARRRELARRGIERAGVYSWERAAGETYEVYRRAARETVKERAIQW
jgi:glycosyltransferase involved in cell wall biosynthesis